jgi:hypothetical protein
LGGERIPSLCLPLFLLLIYHFAFSGGDAGDLEYVELEELNPYTFPMVLQIVAPLRARLQEVRPVLLEMPVNVPGHRQLVLRIDADSEPKDEVDAFCARYNIVDSKWLLQQALSRLHPDATTVLSSPTGTQHSG